jgi:hypothetical protein
MSAPTPPCRPRLFLSYGQLASQLDAYAARLEQAFCTFGDRS